MSKRSIKPRSRKKAVPIVYISKQHYWCLRYLSEVMNIDVSQIIEDYLDRVIKGINSGKHYKKHPKERKHNPYPLKCSMPRELRIKAEIVKINHDLYGLELADMVRMAADMCVRDHISTFPEIEKIIRRYDENKKNNNGELQEK